ATATACVSVTHNLTYGSTDSQTVGDVSTWQNFLLAQGYNVQVTGFFGSLTAAATGQFQLAQGIVPSPSSSGYGSVGPKTMAAVSCAKVTSAPTASIWQSAATTYSSGGVGQPYTVTWSSTGVTACTISKTAADGSVNSSWATGTSGSKVAQPNVV